MNKKLRNFYIIGALLLALFINEVVKGYLHKDQSQSLELEESFKEAYLGGSPVEYFDSLTMIYSNYKYGFSMDFPDHWATDRGVAEHTIIRGARIDSATSFSINVIELSDMKDENITIWQIYDSDQSGVINSFKNMLSETLNSKIYNFTTRKVHVANQEAIEAKANYIIKEVDVEFENQFLAYFIYVMPYMYSVGLHVPKAIYDNNQGYYNSMINNFKIIHAKGI